MFLSTTELLSCRLKDNNQGSLLTSGNAPNYIRLKGSMVMNKRWLDNATRPQLWGPVSHSTKQGVMQLATALAEH